MSFLEDIQGFSKNRLRPTDTVVKTTDGRTLVEVRDEAGTTIRVKKVGGLGFVGDYTPDLQLAPIMDGLFLGSQDVAGDLDLMKSHGVTHILNMAQNVDNFYPNYFRYLKFSLLDMPETDISQHFAETFQFIDQGRGSGKVFVHCNAGVSRAATIVIAYYMKMNKVDFQEAYDHVKSVRPAVRPNDGFMKQLKEFRP